MLQQKIHRILSKTDCSFLCSVRYKGHGSNHWSVLRRTKFPKDLALEHFDDFYANVFGERKWRSMRLGLLCPNKYCAVVNNYSDVDKITTDLESKGAINVKKLIELQAEKLAETGMYSEPAPLDTVFKIDDKMNRISARLLSKEAKSLFPDVPEDQALNYLEAVSAADQSQTINAANGQDERVANSKDADDYLPVDELQGAGNLEINETDIQSRLVRSTDSLQNFVPTSKLKGFENFIPESHHYSYFKSESEFPIFITEDGPLEFPEHLKVYSYEIGSTNDFDSPKRGSTNVLNYYLLNGASLLPVLALGLKPNDRVLDMCAAPGGKSLIILQTLYPRFLLCNDKTEARIKRLNNVLKDYFYDIDEKVVVQMYEGSQIEEPNFYNKILVDVPCTNDRLAVEENDDNLFSSKCVKERLQLPEQQAALLTNALKIVSLGGTVVYSTCSLSPIQNDGVVHMALKRLWEESDKQFVIKDMSKALEPAKILFPLETKLDLKYGFLVCPYLPSNFGPMYFSKIVRVK